MPKRRRPRPGRPPPIQLPLFAEVASLIRVSPERNEHRFYRLEVWPDLFGRALLVRHWGRLGTPGRRRLDPHPDRAPRSTPLPASSAPTPPRLSGTTGLTAPKTASIRRHHRS